MGVKEHLHPLHQPVSLDLWFKCILLNPTLLPELYFGCCGAKICGRNTLKYQTWYIAEILPTHLDPSGPAW